MQRLAFPLLLAFCFVTPLRADQPSADQKQATLKYLHSLQKDNGAFAPDTKPDSKPTLAATSSAFRAIKYFSGEVQNKEGCRKYIQSCFNKADGAFGPTPGAKSDVRSTALGLMALVTCDLPTQDYIGPCTTYLCAHAESYDDRRISAAAYEMTKTKCTLTPSWVAGMRKMANADGTFGSGPAKPRETAGVVAAILRLGEMIDGQEIVVRTLKTGQLADGGWCKEGDKSDLESTYRVLRCFKMLKERPDIAAAEAFIAKCRNADGSYCVQPGQAGNVSGTYYAGICLMWLEEMKK